MTPGLTAILAIASIMGPTTSSADLQFAKQALQNGMFEVESGEMAGQRAANPQVRDFGRRMMREQARLDRTLRWIAAKDAFQVPTDIDAQQQSAIDKLEATAGLAFDRTYLRNEAGIERREAAAFEREMKSGTNPDLRNFARDAARLLQRNALLAQQMENRLG